MLIKLLSVKYISRFLTIGLLTVALIFVGGNSAKAESREQAVDRLTDFLFYRVNPQLNNRKLQPGEREYIYQWQRLRESIDPRVKSIQEVCFRVAPTETGWEFTAINGQTYEQTYDALADAIFYSRHPQRVGQPIGRGDRVSTSEWSAIRREMYISNCGL
ncbi:MAG: hypothetical protein HC849_16560 [Oscillatoriales cyanobacterium RU_3_3]|nr:hypothetical protein [Oscillatoriales cyanobacterium RU_3_3]NJR22523.1 hypothetical protein [Richelia sp. CSU_2_1]